jgi:RNA polymerase sigma factor (sigma-70 family)
MNQTFPDTRQSLLSELQASDRGPAWQVSWERFFDLYHQPLRAMCSNSYRYHTGGQEPSDSVIEDTVAAAVADFCSKSQFNYAPEKGRLRGFLKAVCNARVVDHLRKQKHWVQYGGLSDLDDGAGGVQLPEDSSNEIEQFRLSLLATLLEDVRKRVSPQQYAIFEMIKVRSLSPEQVATELGVKRGVIDNTVYRVMNVLRDLAARAEYRNEWQA